MKHENKKLQIFSRSDECYQEREIIMPNKSITFDDFLAQKLKDPAFKRGCEIESAKLEDSVAHMKGVVQHEDDHFLQPSEKSENLFGSRS
ncbi:hypothetical protein [Schleiferilactobacillus perolens]|uniref:Uncharacterized protein n=1 Tax=Schleiferilactobacillus perolens DSM 12744 TaxID=1423792 RepID=A0A0R1N4Q1_9LACO|nr:hypothetical protein [Schleiferilactobacillus perolens]KRL11080.1 hypothetical protein FD09_GL000805 [Schleiferilactobacillus perolens DSM 12744]